MCGKGGSPRGVPLKAKYVAFFKEFLTHQLFKRFKIEACIQ